MSRNVFISSLCSVVFCGLVGGSIVYLSTLAYAAATSTSPVPPPPLLGGPAGGPPRPAEPPSFSGQSAAPIDFLDHSIPPGYGLIRGRVIDDNTGAMLENARISIPELKLSTTSDSNGKFEFEPIKVGTDGTLLVTVVAHVPGYGVHTLINVGVFSQDTATVLLTMKKGTVPTRYLGGLPRNGKSAKYSQADLPLSTFSTDPGSLGSGPLSPLSFSSTATPPLYIRVGIFTLNSTGVKSGSLLRVDTVDFDFYQRHVLGNEWIASWGNTAPESLKAGALAVKEYAWYHVLHPKTGYDCDNSQSCQVYDPYVSYSNTDKAINDQSTTGWYQSDANGLPTIFESFYEAGDYSSTSVCTVNPSANCMTQNGSHYWADHGKDYRWILSNYYTSGALTYFTYAPRWPMAYASGAGTNSITLTYSSASSTSYAIYRYDNNSTWVLKATTSNTSWTDSSATTIGSTTYAYGVDAYGPGGWSPSSFNGGWLSATPKSASNPPSPTTTAFFIATSTIEIRARTSATSIDQYIVDKWSATSSQWVTVYDGLPSAVNNHGTDHSTASTALPIAFIDNTEYDGGAGDFVYRDTTWMTPSVTSSYTVSYHSYA